MNRHLVIAALLACAGVFTPAQAQVKLDRESASGNAAPGGKTQVKSAPLQSSVVDLKCESVFESPDLVRNLAELVAIAGGAAISGRDWKKPAIEFSKQHVWLPIAVEELVGAQMHKRLVEAEQLRDPSQLNSTEQRALKRADETLNRIVQILPSDQPYEFKLFVTSDDSENLGANPGGFVYITRAALQKNSDSLVFALGHEVAHVAKRHVTRGLAVEVIDASSELRAIKTIVDKDPAALDRVVGTGLTLQRRLRKFSQAQEEEADGCAIRVLVNQPEFDLPKSAGAFLEELNQAGSAGVAESHPGYPERGGAMRKAYSKWSRAQYIGDAAAGQRRQDISPLAAAARFSEGGAKGEGAGDEKKDAGLGVGEMFRKLGNSVGGVLRSFGGSQQKAVGGDSQ